jgi:hypothetical protein
VDSEQILTVGNTVLARREVDDIDGPDGLNLIQGTLAYVGDYSYFGFSSPIEGSRYRFEAMPTTGSLNFVSFLADYRKYFFANPLTFAVRGLHLGRYFGDSENPRLDNMNIGFETLVRGYGVTSFNSSECSFDPQSPYGCPEFNRLLGSKMAVFNAEIRLPVFGVRGYGLVNFPALPMELSWFLDGGVAWTADDKPVIKLVARSSERIPIFSTGLSARINLLGVLPFHFYYAYPFQRPDQGWQFGFLLAPGW